MESIWRFIYTDFLPCISGLTRAKLVQSTLISSKSTGLSEILRDIRTSAYQI